MVQETLKATGMMKDLNPTVINFPTLKPIDKELIIETAKTHEVLVHGGGTQRHRRIRRRGGGGVVAAGTAVPALSDGNAGRLRTQWNTVRPAGYYGLDAKHIQAFVERFHAELSVTAARRKN